MNKDNIKNEIFVYDRINRIIHSCEITNNESNIWLYFIFNGEKCCYWNMGCKVSALGKPFKCDDYRYLVSNEIGSLKIIEKSDKLVYNFLSEQCKNIINGGKKITD